MNNLFICTVILDIPYMQGWYYLHTAKLKIGSLVSVPTRNKICTGIVIECINYQDYSVQNENLEYKNKLKYINQVSHVIFSTAWIEFIKFIAKYYHEGMGEVALSSLPIYIKQNKNWSTFSQFLPITYQIQTNHTINPRTLNGKNLVKALENAHSYTLTELIAICPQAKVYIKKWQKFIIKKEVELIPLYNDIKLNLGYELNIQQQKIADKIIESSEYAVHLIHGITGSGKTAIYLTIIAYYLKYKPLSQILVLVPEINLTPQLINLLQTHFSNIPIAILNSNLTDKQRAINWYWVYSGYARIIIGTRLASMSMLPNLSLIIIDEEHDTSYKQQEGIRYHARDICIWQAKQLNIPIILASATPSLETYYHAKSNKYIYHSLNLQASNIELPAVHLINLENYQKNQMLGGIISPILAKKIHTTIEDKQQQVLLFLNRRGFAPVMFCADCKYIFACKNCSANLVLHKPHNKLICHHCGYEHLTFSCHKCASKNLLPIGAGTQKIEQVLIDYFPQYKSIRVDSDTIGQAGSLEKQLNLINTKQVDIIISTQMLSKGHDFKYLGMVGVLNPDGMLYSYNMRSQEQLFCQLMQVIGRAGRHKKGSVYIQTMFSEHPLYKALQKHNYNEYAQVMLGQRQELNLSPFNFEAKIHASHHLAGQSFEQLKKLKSIILPINDNLKTNCFITTVTAHSMLKYKNMERAYFIIECSNRQKLHIFINAIMPHLHKLKCEWYLEILP